MAGTEVERAPLTSLEKLMLLPELVRELVPPDEQTARILQLLQTVTPHMGTLLPDDPEQLDGYLLTLAAWALHARSDGAPLPATIEELLAHAQLEPDDELEP